MLMPIFRQEVAGHRVEFPGHKLARSLTCHHAKAVDRAGWQAQFATGAFCRNSRMHQQVRADNRVDRAGVPASRTANAQ